MLSISATQIVSVPSKIKVVNLIVVLYQDKTSIENTNFIQFII